MYQIDILTSAERTEVVRSIVGQYEVGFEGATEYDPACRITIRVPFEAWPDIRSKLRNT